MQPGPRESSVSPVSASGVNCSLILKVMDYESKITRDPQICGGQPVIKGTRVTLRTVLASLAEGATVGEILGDFPTLNEDDVRTVIAFAAASAGEDLPVPGLPREP